MTAPSIHPIGWQAFEITSETEAQLRKLKQRLENLGFEKTHTGTIQATKILEFRKGPEELRIMFWHGEKPWGNIKMIIGITAATNTPTTIGRHQRLFHIDEFDNLYAKFKGRSKQIQDIIDKLGS